MKISLSKQAAKYYEKAPANIQERFDKAFEELMNGCGDVKPMAGYPGQYRLRIGDYRAIFTYSASEDMVIVIRIRPRGDVYK